MAVVGVANLLELLQPEFGQRVHSFMNESVRVYNQFEIAPRIFDGKHLVEAITASVPGSFQFLGPGTSSLPSPGNYTVKNTQITPARSYGTISVDWDMLAQSSGPAAFAEAWTLTMERMNTGMLLFMERITCSDGSGVLNRLRCGVSGTALTAGGINTSAGTGTAGSTTLSATSASWSFMIHQWDAASLEIGCRLEFWSGTWTQASWRAATKRDTPSQGFYTVSNVVPYDAGDGPVATTVGGYAIVTITEASPGTNPPLAGDFIAIDEAILQDATPSTTNAANEMQGLDAHITNDDFFLQPSTDAGYTSDDTHQGIATASNGRWIAPTVTGAGTNAEYLQQSHLENLGTRMGVFGSDTANKANCYFGHNFSLQKYREQFYGAERFSVTTATPNLPTGATSSNTDDVFMTFGGTPMYQSRYIRPDKVYLVNKRDMKRYQLKAFEFKGVHQNFQGRPADQQDGFSIQQMGTVNRTSSGAVTNLKYN